MHDGKSFNLLFLNITDAMKPFAIIFIFFAFFSLVFAATSSVTASVTVVCPGKVSINVLPAYMKFLNISLNYSLEQTANCIIPNATGTFSIINKLNSASVFSKRVVFYNVSSIERQSLSISSNALANTTYYAVLNLTELSYKIQGTSSTFELVNPAIITTNVSAFPSTASPSTPILIKIGLHNKGSLASSNIIINTSISGPQQIKLIYTASPLAPGGAENISYTITNLTSAGLYNVNVYSSYNTILGHEILNSTSHASTSFTISTPAPPPSPSPTPAPTPTPSPIPVPKPVTPIPGISLVSAPLIVSSSVGSSSLSQLSLINTANTTELVNITVAKPYSSLVQLSASSFYIKPNENIAVQLAFIANSTLKPGVYTIPINISASIKNKTRSITEYMQFYAYSKQTSSIASQIVLANNTNIANGILKIANPTNKTLFNVRVSTMLPKGLVSNISDITAYGLINNITESNGYYIINWLVPYLPSGSSTYAYYTILKPQNQVMLANIQNLMEVPSYVKPSSTLRIININVPTFYVNQSNKIIVSELYTGTTTQSVMIQLLAQPGIVVKPGLVIVNASPNEVLTQAFNVTSSSAGTMMLSLYLAMQGYNATYSIPALVLAPITTTTIPQAIQPKPIAISSYYLEILLIFVILIVLVLALLARRRNMPKYSEEKLGELKELREMIKRE